MDRVRVFDLPGTRVAVFRRPKGIFAVDDHCPHRSGPLSGGWIEGEEIVCPWHQWSFRLSDGICTNISGQSVRRFSVAVEGGRVSIDLDPTP